MTNVIYKPILCVLLVCGGLSVSAKAIQTAGQGCGSGDKVIYDGKPLDWTDEPLTFLGSWDLSSNGTLEIELENTSTNDDVRLCVDIGTGDESRCRLTMIPAGFSGTVTLDVCPRLAHPEVAAQITNMRTTPFMGGDRDRKYDPTRISEITLRHHWTGASTASQGRTPVVRVRRVVAKNTSKREWPAWYAMGEKDFFPFVDQYGQFRYRDWPRKVKKDADLKGAVKAEERDLDANPPPTVWDRYGGWSKGPRLEATGRFRLTKWQDKWWFVDPDGCLWWSHGVVRVSPSSAVTPLDGREKYFAGLPPDEATEPFAEFYHTNDELLKPYFDKKGWKRTYDFSAANLKRKYGVDWRGVYADLSHRRLHSWGLNTIANSSDAAIRKMNRTPWIERLETRGPRCKEQKNEGFWWPVPDPFHPEFRRYLREQLESRREELTSPWCVGIFVDNEHNWAGIGENTVREYFKVVREEIKRLDPNLLYFGCRFAGSPERVVRLCAEYADALSYNPYRLRLDGLKLPQGVDKPILIGEFHFGSTVDTGLFNPSLVQMNDQSQRARAYCRYVTDALRHPQIVGTHWHQFSDQAVTGRFDGENFNVGFTDVCDSPYPEMRDALRQIGHRMYDMRAGKTPTVTFDCAYPGGNVKVMSFDEDSGIVRIAPDLRDTEGHWFHFDFTVRGASGRTLKFRFPQDGNLYLSTLGPAICKDGVHWTWLNADGKRHEPANAFDYTFGKEDHAVRFALSIPYVQKDCEAFTAQWRMSPEVKFDVLCKSQSGRRDVELLRVPARRKAEWLFVFTARHHACETTGDPPMEGVLAELMSDSSESHWAREHADFLFVPFMDKDGVEDGDQGKNRRPWDYNRDHAKGRYSAVRAIKDLIIRESAGKKIVFFDFHSPFVRALKWDPEQEHAFTFGTIHKELAENWERFRANWKTAQAGGKLTYDGLYDIPAKKGYWNVMKKAWDSGLLASDPWVRTLPNAKLATCCEFGYSLCGGVNSRESMRELGANLLKAAVRTVAGPILHPIFRDGVVFAEGKPIRVYGSGTGRVEVAFDGETRTAEGGADGWLVEFPPHGKSVKPMTMEITLAGAKTLLRDIRIGGVFLMAGQSNQRVRLGDSTVSYREWADEPNLRQYMVSGVQASCFSPTDGWFSFSAQGAADWPQLTALFGRERLAAGAGVFGAVGCHQGASVIESWLPEVIATQPRFARPKDKLHPDHFHPTYGVWNGPGVLYEKMFCSIGPFSFSGVVWYQGESNTGPGEAENYPALLKELVSTWRRDLRDPALPFLVVQIADFDSRRDADWKAVQDAQSVAAKQIPGVTLVRSADVCESADIHPRDKTRLARRLSEGWDRARNSQGTSW